MVLVALVPAGDYVLFGLLIVVSNENVLFVTFLGVFYVETSQFSSMFQFLPSLVPALTI